MKKTLTLCGIIFAMGTAAVLAGTGTPVIDAREQKQEQRIDQGVASGKLTPVEAGRLEAQQTRIEQRESRMKADGKMTRRERAALTRQQNRASRQIYRQKHDGQTAPTGR